MNIFNKIVSYIGASVFFAGFLIATPSNPSSADVIKSDECYPAVLILRGSAEARLEIDERKYYKKINSDDVSLLETNGFEGERVSKLIRPFVDQTNPSQTVSKVRFIGIDYPALDVAPPMPEDNPDLTIEENLGLKAGAIIRHIIDYQDSYNQGAQNIVDFINSDTRQGCDTRYMLVGYSQGVLSARLAMNLLDQNNDKVISTYSIGDPFQKANGVTSNRQYSEASTGKQGTGIYRKYLEYFMEINEYDPTNNDDTVVYNLAEQFANADHMIYRDEGAGSLVSRSICHKDDKICDYSGDLINLDLSEHLNYFEESSDIEDPGEIDLAYEISEFDKQVQTLANSTSYNPRERALTKTLSLIGEETVYNIANLQIDDRCDWDYNSDGTIDLANIACGTLNYTHTSEDANMTVIVTDSFGVKHKLTSETEALSRPSIDSPFEINPNKWYQFEAYQEPLSEKDYNNGWFYDENGDWVFDEEWEYPYNRDENCLEWNQSIYNYIDGSNFNSLSKRYCDYSPSDKDANDSLQVFRSVPHLTSSGVKNRVISGYHEGYSWQTQDEYYLEDKIGLSKTSSSINQDFDAKFAKIINNEYYFNFMQKDKCLTVYDNEDGYHYEDRFVLERCNLNNKNQLFKARQVIGEFGKLSVEHDKDAPTKPTDLFIEIDLENINFNWTLSEDPERNAVSTYQLFKKDNSTGEYNFVEQIHHYNVLPVDTSDAQPGETQTYKIVAIDKAGNTSEASTITFKIPDESISAPPTPVVSNISNNGETVTLSKPQYNENLVEELEVFYFDDKIGSFTENTFTYETNRTYHIFSYRYKIAENVYSVKSEILRID